MDLHLKKFLVYNSTDTHGQTESVWEADQGDAQQASDGSVAERGPARCGPDEGLHQQSSSQIQETWLEELPEHLSTKLDPAFIEYSVSATARRIIDEAWVYGTVVRSVMRMREQKIGKSAELSAAYHRREFCGRGDTRVKDWWAIWGVTTGRFSAPPFGSSHKPHYCANIYL